jgi:hypothetical protein
LLQKLDRAEPKSTREGREDARSNPLAPRQDRANGCQVERARRCERIVIDTSRRGERC